MMKFNEMAIRMFCMLSFLTRYGDSEVTGKLLTTYDNENAHYCHICHDHTMCLFPYDDIGSDCVDMENSYLEKEDIETVLDSHNFYRVIVANGKEYRGNPGPQPAAKSMMELIWDDELAAIARRWALQCKLFQKDQCRDVERFGVWQNINVFDMDSVGSSTGMERIRFHIESWYDEVEDFDNAEVGLVNYSSVRQLSSYIPLASATFIYVGCGRAIYTPDLNKTAASYNRDGVTPGGFGNRVEILVCNYGPVDRTVPGQLYELGQPGLCPSGTLPSEHYKSLCRTIQDSPKSSQKIQMKMLSNSTFSITCAVILNYFMLLLHLMI